MQPGFNFYYEKKALMFWPSFTTVPSCVWVKTGSYLCATFFFQVLQTIQCACVVLLPFHAFLYLSYLFDLIIILY